MRERLRPYVHAQAKHTSLTGIPMMRPLLVEFPTDPGVVGRRRPVHVRAATSLLPRCSSKGPRRGRCTSRRGRIGPTPGRAKAWLAGTKVDVAAPLHQIPLFLRDGAELPIRSA